MRHHFALLLIVSLACRQSPTGGQREKEPEAVTSPAPADAAPAPAQPSREELVAKAIERVPAIAEQLAELRQLELESPVVAEQMDVDAFRAYVKEEIARDYPGDKGTKVARALARVGLIDSGLNLAQVLEDALASQVGAFYDPARRKFFMVMVMPNAVAQDVINAHELTHALQDQHFNLKKFYYGHEGSGPSSLSEDELNARRFLVEGEATFAMMAYSAKSMTKLDVLAKERLGALGGQLKMMAGMDIEQLVAMTKQQAAMLAELGPDMKKSIEALDRIPLYITVPLLAAYMEGSVPVFEVFSSGGWKAVDALYANPPQSTEQMLHPKDKLIGKRDMPVSFDLKPPQGWSLVHSEVIGELGWRIYFQKWKDERATAVAAGWDGDRVAVFERDTELVGLIATTWDSGAEAEEFATAYQASIEKRYPGEPEKVQLVRTGSDVLIVDGSDDPTLMAHLRRVKKTIPRGGR